MKNEKILKLDLHTKIIYFIMHLFGTISIFGILGWAFSDVSKTIPVGWIVLGFGFLLGLYFSIEGIIKYKKFVMIKDDKLMVCKGSENTPFVIQEYNFDDIDKFSSSTSGLAIEKKEEKTTILNLKASPIFMFVFAGWLVIPIKKRGETICKKYINILDNYKNGIIDEDEKNVSALNSTLCWFINLIFLGISGIILLVTLFFGFLSIGGAVINTTDSTFTKYYDEKIAQDPNNPELYNSRAVFKKDKDAIADYDKAIELNPKYTEAYLSRGETKERLKDYDGATSDYKKVIELDPKNYRAFVDLGSLKHEQEDYPAAEEYFNKAIEIDPENDDAYFYKWMLHTDYKPEEKDAIYAKYKELQEKNKTKNK